MSPQLIDHFTNPRNVGELPAPAVTVQVENPICGDILRLSVLFEDGKAAEVRYKVRGCTASIAAGSALTELVAGRNHSELKALSTDNIETALGGISNESKHVAVLCVDALRALFLEIM